MPRDPPNEYFHRNAVKNILTEQTLYIASV
jgi:hypothetical protein